MSKKILRGLSVALSIVFVCILMQAPVFAAESTSHFYATIWSLVPPIIAIALALITKEVYSSLFIGIVVGALLYANFGLEGTINHLFNEGFIAALADSYNMGILIFLVLLGTIVALMNRAGGSLAFGKWTLKNIKTRVGAQLMTVLLGCLIFIDDYFNCLTVGSVMKPVTDSHKISRAKLAYLIDATAAPVCIIAPISSWAAAVSGFVEGEDGLSLFIRAIPYNFYALLTIFMMVSMVILKIEFGPMARHEENALNGDLFSEGERNLTEAKVENVNEDGRVIDLVFPIFVLILSCVISMIWTGGFFTGVDFVTAFSQSDASVGLAVGGMIALIIIIAFYVYYKRLTFVECMDCLSDGFRAMVPAILILSMAWTLKGMTDSLGAKEFVATSISMVAGDLQKLLPALIFLVGALLAFATGTSWGTFGMLIPIVVAVFQGSNPELMLISISACMAGAVCGDHCSPISDTTIMASAGAQSNHVNHVSTQLPYAMVAAGVSFVSYIIAGYSQSVIISLPIAFLLMAITIGFIYKIKGNKN
ncbi:MAG: Na+/H+ antiporter NhaC family protein [Firmicutes bacterium]|nr:Na+/H+ antiporter NhaC family protein [Bacillota bacterium]